MGERKVMNKYYPPDFDPAKLPRARRNGQMKIRTMLPVSIRCNTCRNYMYEGTKYNSRKEVAKGETYLNNIKIFRFYSKCTKCSTEFTIKTDPKNSDYVVENGATRNLKPHWAKDDEEEETGDAMKTLENRTRDSKREMDSLAALEELKSLKSRHAKVSSDDMLLSLQRSSAKQVQEKKKLELEAIIKSFYRSKRDRVKIIEDEDDDSDDEGAKPSYKKRKTTTRSEQKILL